MEGTCESLGWKEATEAVVGLFDVPNCATKSGSHFLGKEHQA